MLFRVKFRTSHDWANSDLSFGGWVIDLLLNHTTSGCAVCYSEARACQGSHCMAHSILSLPWAFPHSLWTHPSHHGFQMFISVYGEMLASRRTGVTQFPDPFSTFFISLNLGLWSLEKDLCVTMWLQIRYFLMSIFGNVWQSLHLCNALFNRAETAKPPFFVAVGAARWRLAFHVTVGNMKSNESLEMGFSVGVDRLGLMSVNSVFALTISLSGIWKHMFSLSVYFLTGGYGCVGFPYYSSW